jgi:hypothetical protein
MKTTAAGHQNVDKMPPHAKTEMQEIEKLCGTESTT